jgi:integrase/recombinase XerD
VTPPAIAEYVAFLKTKVATSSAVAYLACPRMAVLAMAPERNWDWMKRLIARLKRTATPVRDTGASIVGANELFHLGLDLMAESGAEAGITTWHQAIDYRDGLMIALLAAHPLRRRNFMAIEIGKHLVQRSEELWLQFDRTETKNHEPIEAPVPDCLVPHLGHYIETVRSWLCAQTGHRDPRFPFKAPGDRLWVSKTGSAMSPEIFYSMIRERTEARFGSAVYPHLFRHDLATQVAIVDPERVRMAQRLLGHRSPRTTERYYIHAKTHLANQRVQEHIASKRRIARKSLSNSALTTGNVDD